MHVDVERVLSNDLPPIRGRKPEIGEYIVTHFNDFKEIIHQSELHQAFIRDTEEPDSKLVEIAKDAQIIIDLEIMVDEDNAETLLHDAVEAAHRIKRLI